MEQRGLIGISANRRRALERALLNGNALTVRYGLTLSAEAVVRLAERRATALLDADRVELGESAVCGLVNAFCDSPYLEQESYEELLGTLIDTFYYYKTACMDLLSDEELLQAMRARFDEYEGGVEALLGLGVEELCRCRWLADEEEAYEPEE